MRRQRKKNRQGRKAFALSLIALLIMQGLLPFMRTDCGADGMAYAADTETKQFELDVTDNIIYYGDWFTRVMYFKFTDSGEKEKGYCMNPELVPPSEGVHTARIYNYKNVPDEYRALWKALYYLEGGDGYPEVADVWDSVYHYVPGDPDAWSKGRDQAYALSHMVVSDLSPSGSGGDLNAGETYIRLKNAMITRLKSMPDPPKTFQIAVYVSGSGYQNISGYCAPLSVTGELTLVKKNAEPALTEGNGCYSLSGAEYGVYTDKNCSSKAGLLTTDGSGRTGTLTLEEGTYYIREDKASPGYVPDRTVHQAEVVADETVEVRSEETPQRAMPEWLFAKSDLESAGVIPKGAASLEGAVFTVTWYGGLYTSEKEAAGAGAMKREWQFATDEQGKCLFNESSKTGGDAMFYDAAGKPVLPCGTLFITESQPPKGYLLNENTYVWQIRPVAGKTDPVITMEELDEPPVVPEQVMRGGFRFNKVGEGSAEPLAGVPFRITSKTTGESHILFTDSNGVLDTESWPHTKDCNAGDAAVSEDGTVDESFAGKEYGIWFYGLPEDDQSGAGAPDDAKRALPYDSYLVEEIPCGANRGYRMVSFTVRIERDQLVIDRGTVTDLIDIAIRTEAVCRETGNHFAPQIGAVTIVDTVSYEGAMPGELYHVKGVLMNRETGEPVLVNGEPVTAEREFIALRKDGTAELSFEVDAADLAGMTTVVFEELYRGDELAAEHKDLNDDWQTVRFPVLKTHAAKTENGTVVDHVQYSGLVPGETYTMTARLMDLDSGKAVEEHAGSITFTPEEADGTVDVPIKVKEAGPGYRVVFEQCMLDEELVALHEDLASKEQTILIREEPKPASQDTSAVRPHAPKTGDPSQTVLLWGILLGSLTLLVSAGFALKHER